MIFDLLYIRLILNRIGQKAFHIMQTKQTIYSNEESILDFLRDWGYAKDYVGCMWLILQNDCPTDVVNLWGDPTQSEREARLESADYLVLKSYL